MYHEPSENCVHFSRERKNFPVKTKKIEKSLLKPLELLNNLKFLLRESSILLMSPELLILFKTKTDTLIDQTKASPQET